MLYQRNMYPLAIELAQNSGLDANQQSLIYRKFGDHLYSKADFDGAMVQYIRAIDTTEPSQVIRKVGEDLECLTTERTLTERVVSRQPTDTKSHTVSRAIARAQKSYG
jgi:hypothetical protein